MYQLKLKFNKQRGRPKLKDRQLKWIRREKRPLVLKLTPALVTIKLKKGIVESLRNKVLYKVFKRAVCKARIKGLAIVHFSIQKDHIHFLIEAKSNQEISKGMQSLMLSMSKAISFLTNKTQGIFKDRYHLSLLTNPTLIKNALYYVLRNGQKHQVSRYPHDPFSSVARIDSVSIKMRGLFRSLSDYFIYRQELEELTARPRNYWLRKSEMTSIK